MPIFSENSFDEPKEQNFNSINLKISEIPIPNSAG